MKHFTAVTGMTGGMWDPHRMTAPLAIYLDDHFAGSTGAIDRVRWSARRNAGTELGDFLGRLAAEIEEDRTALRRVMDAAGVRRPLVKATTARLAERAGRLKLNGGLVRQSPLTPFVELEALGLGITGKLRLWEVLRHHGVPAASVVDLDQLIARAQQQIADVEEHRLAAGAALRG